jgi:hypothetical protein
MSKILNPKSYSFYKFVLTPENPYITTTSAALSSTNGIKERQIGEYKVRSLQDYHSAIED